MFEQLFTALLRQCADAGRDGSEFHPCRRGLNCGERVAELNGTVLAIHVAGKEWDVLLLIPGAVIGAIFGLIATIWWEHLQRSKGLSRSGASTRSETEHAPPNAGLSAHASASAQSEVTVTIQQVARLPSRRRSDGSNGILDDLGPAELGAMFLITGIVLCAAYAVARPWIESAYLSFGGLGLGLCMTLLATNLIARTLGGRRILTVLTLASGVFAATVATPWLIDSADYPFKDYTEVLRLVGQHPMQVSQLYGSFGMFFLLYQLVGIVCMGFAAVTMMAVLGALILGVTAVLNDDASARLAGFRRGSVGLSVLSAALCAIGVWVIHGSLHRIADPSNAYAMDAQDPHVFDITRSAGAPTGTVTFRVDESAAVMVSIRRRGSKRILLGKRVRADAGANTVRLTLPRGPTNRLVLVLQARDRVGRRSPTRVVIVSRIAERS